MTLTPGPGTGLPNGASLSSPTGLIHNVPVAPGETCTVTESGLPAVPIAAVKACGGYAYWDSSPTYTPSQTIPITLAGPNAVTVTNTLRCKPTMSVTKTFVDATGSPTPIQPPAFNVLVTCNPTAIPPTNLSLTPPATATSSNSPPAQGLVQNLPVIAGETCTVSEPVLPAIPAAAQLICDKTAYWNSSPAYTPSSTIPISATGPNVVTVTNTLRCGTLPMGSLVVNKTVINNTNGQVSTAGLSYPATATCGGVPTSLTLTESTLGTVNSLAPNTNCSVQEGAYPTVSCPTDYLPSWSTTFIPSASVSVSAPGTTTVTVQNTLDCKLIAAVRVAKQVINNTQAVVSGLSYPMTVSCVTGTMPATSFPISVSGGSSWTVHNIANGSACSVSETLPPPPTTGCVGGPVPTWVTPPVYNPPTVNAAGGAGGLITVTNTLICAQPPQGPHKPTLQCHSPLVANPAGTECVCPPGQLRRGGSCVESPKCKSPAKLNKAGTACICPEDMDMQDNSCVPRRSNIKPRDVIRGFPGQGGRGTGGGGGASPRGGGGGAIGKH